MLSNPDCEWNERPVGVKSIFVYASLSLADVEMQ
jgi:hypothetical protein